MDNSFRVSSRQTLNNLNTIFNCLAYRQGAAYESLPQSFTFEQFRNDVRISFRDADVIHNENVGMIEHAGRAGFLLKAAEALCIR